MPFCNHLGSKVLRCLLRGLPYNTGISLSQQTFGLGDEFLRVLTIVRNFLNAPGAWIAKDTIL